MPIEKNYFSISPINDNPLQSSGTNGVEKLLETKTLVLTGQFILKDQATDEGFRDPNYTNLSNANNGANIEPSTACNFPNHGGVQNVIDKVVIQTKKTNTELINIHNYPAYSSLREAYTNNDEDYLWGVAAVLCLIFTLPLIVLSYSSDSVIKVVLLLLIFLIKCIY